MGAYVPVLAVVELVERRVGDHELLPAVAPRDSEFGLLEGDGAAVPGAGRHLLLIHTRVLSPRPAPYATARVEVEAAVFGVRRALVARQMDPPAPVRLLRDHAREHDGRCSARHGDAPHNLIEKLQGDWESYTPSNNNLDAGLPVQQRRLVRLR